MKRKILLMSTLAVGLCGANTYAGKHDEVQNYIKRAFDKEGTHFITGNLPEPTESLQPTRGLGSKKPTFGSIKTFMTLVGNVGADKPNDYYVKITQFKLTLIPNKSKNPYEKRLKIGAWVPVDNITKKVDIKQWDMIPLETAKGIQKFLKKNQRYDSKNYEQLAIFSLSEKKVSHMLEKLEDGGQGEMKEEMRNELLKASINEYNKNNKIYGDEKLTTIEGTNVRRNLEEKTTILDKLDERKKYRLIEAPYHDHKNIALSKSMIRRADMGVFTWFLDNLKEDPNPTNNIQPKEVKKESILEDIVIYNLGRAFIIAKEKSLHEKNITENRVAVLEQMGKHEERLKKVFGDISEYPEGAYSKNEEGYIIPPRTLYTELGMLQPNEIRTETPLTIVLKK